MKHIISKISISINNIKISDIIKAIKMSIKHYRLYIIIINYLHILQQTEISQNIIYPLYICTIFTILIKVATTDFLEQLFLHTRNLFVVLLQAASVNLLACVMIDFELSNMADSQAYGDNYKQLLIRYLDQIFFFFFFFKCIKRETDGQIKIKNRINQLVCLRDFDNI